MTRAKACQLPSWCLLLALALVGVTAADEDPEESYERAKEVMLRFQNRKTFECVSFQYATDGTLDGGNRRVADWNDSPAAIIEIHCNGKAFTDLEFDGIERLIHLKRLYARGTSISDAGFGRLAKLRHLSNLVVDGDGITDKGMESIGQIHSLRSLSLMAPKVSDAGIRHLAGLRGLTDLSLRTPQVTDEGYRHLGELHDLVQLDLCAAQISDKGVMHLAGLDHLEVLNLWHCKITDASAAAFKRLPKLKRLNVIFTEFGYYAADDVRKTNRNIEIYPFFDVNGAQPPLEVTDAHRANKDFKVQSIPSPAGWERGIFWPGRGYWQQLHPVTLPLQYPFMLPIEMGLRLTPQPQPQPKNADP